ncbi:MAG: T9SS type A sorting domain-containing protein, partial [Candidatus Stygibacter australis]|nr:T9SS type A sorting domain-containing protein [Candidatus Stygibacter australis]
HNIGGVTATGIEAIAVENDPFVAISAVGGYCEEIMSGESMLIEYAFCIAIGEEIPDQYNFTIDIWLESEQGSWSEELEFTAYKQSSFVVEPDSLDLEILWGENFGSGITLRNAGELPQNYYIELIEMETCNIRSIEISPSEGWLDADESVFIELHIDTGNMTEMEYDYELVVSSDNWETVIVPIAIRPSEGGNAGNEIPEATRLRQNYPNPFNPETSIIYELAKAGNVTLEVYNIKGQMVRRLVNRFKAAGSFKVVWDGRDEDDQVVSSGVYIYRLKTEREIYSRRMLLLK